MPTPRGNWPTHPLGPDPDDEVTWAPETRDILSRTFLERLVGADWPERRRLHERIFRLHLPLARAAARARARSVAEEERLSLTASTILWRTLHTFDPADGRDFGEVAAAAVEEGLARCLANGAGEPEEDAPG